MADASCRMAGMYGLTVVISPAIEDDDASLHAAIIAGEHRAFELWEGRYRQRMITAAHKRGMPVEDAEQAWISETLPAVWARAAEILPRGAGLVHYAFGAMRNQARAYLKARTQQPLSLEALPERLVVGVDGMPAAMAPARRAAVLACLARLSPRDRVLVELLYMERIDPAVIAERCGIDVRSVRRAGERARQRIRPYLEEALGVRPD